MSQTNTPTVVSPDAPFFPFALDDLLYWVVKRKDGMIIKYRVVGPDPASTNYKSSPTLGGWCKHNPANDPVWHDDQIDLYIADAPGCRAHKDDFNFLLDCGDILPLSYVSPNNSVILAGDPELVRLMAKHCEVSKTNRPRCLKIDWNDRAAPPLQFEFWPTLIKKLISSGGSVLTACQGGHGRSGTGLVCLMMTLNHEYTPADAIIHLRAIHCPRAIESVDQHTYIGAYGKFLGRENDIERLKGVVDFRAEFLKLKKKSATPYQERLTNEEGEKK